VVKIYSGRGDVENRIKEGKNTLRWDKTSCHPFEANEARLKMEKAICCEKSRVPTAQFTCNTDL
jgi:hypothetical protein